MANTTPASLDGVTTFLEKDDEAADITKILATSGNTETTAALAASILDIGQLAAKERHWKQRLKLAQADLELQAEYDKAANAATEAQNKLKRAQDTYDLFTQDNGAEAKKNAQLHVAIATDKLEAKKAVKKSISDQVDNLRTLQKDYEHDRSQAAEALEKAHADFEKARATWEQAKVQAEATQAWTASAERFVFEARKEADARLSQISAEVVEAQRHLDDALAEQARVETRITREQKRAEKTLHLAQAEAEFFQYEAQLGAVREEARVQGNLDIE